MVRDNNEHGRKRNVRVRTDSRIARSRAVIFGIGGREDVLPILVSQVVNGKKVVRVVITAFCQVQAFPVVRVDTRLCDQQWELRVQGGFLCT